MTKISFGILTPQQSLHFKTLQRTWKEAELSGFESAWLVDHFIPYDFPNCPITEPCLECWVTLSALAMDTATIRLGPLVSCNSYRSPALLAKMAASLDVISGGRVNFGIGAGWLRPEHEAFGYPFPKTPERIERLREAIDIIIKMWTEEKTTYIGTHYKIVNAVNNPKPLQKPHPPIYIGAEHERMVKFAAEKADVWNFPSDINAYSLKEYEGRVHTLQSHCDLIGRNPNSIIKSWLGIALLAKNETQLNEKIKLMESRYVSQEKLLRQIVGTAKECAQKIGEYIDLGVTEFILIFPEAHQASCLREFSDNVMYEFGAGKLSGTN